MEAKPLFGALTVYRERGGYLRRREQFVQASAAYHRAWEVCPEDVRLLLGRSLVGIDAVQPRQAYDDAEAAFNLDRTNITSRYVRASALFAMSEFERSLVMHHRGARLRKKPPYFKEGINMCEATIQNCVGEYAGQVLHNNRRFIKKTATQDEQEPEVNIHKSRIPRPVEKKRLSQMEAFRHRTLSRVLAMKYLGPMACDKFFLQSLVEDPRLIGANSKGSKELKNLASEALHSLSERQEMLRCQRPYYAIQFAEKTQSKHETAYRKRMLENDRIINTQTADRFIKQIERSMREYRVNEMVTQAERMQIFLDSKTPRTLPEKEYFIDRLYRVIGEGYLSQYRLAKGSEQSTRRRIAFLMGLNIGRPSSYDSVIAKYPYKFTNTKTELEKLMKSLDVCENSMMKCWLYHEISHLLCKLKNFSLAKFYAKRCQREAEEIGSSTWWLNGCFMLMAGDMQQGNSNDVRVMVEEAIQYTRTVNAGTSGAFLERCAEIAGEALNEGEEQDAKRRQNQILDVIDDSLRDETEVLFKRIANVPTGRRFSVLPTKPEKKTMTSIRKKHRQRGLSIVLPEKPLPTTARTKIPGLQVFDS